MFKFNFYTKMNRKRGVYDIMAHTEPLECVLWVSKCFNSYIDFINISNNIFSRTSGQNKGTWMLSIASGDRKMLKIMTEHDLMNRTRLLECMPTASTLNEWPQNSGNAQVNQYIGFHNLSKLIWTCSSSIFRLKWTKRGGYII